MEDTSTLPVASAKRLGVTQALPFPHFSQPLDPGDPTSYNMRFLRKVSGVVLGSSLHYLLPVSAVVFLLGPQFVCSFNGTLTLLPKIF